MATGDDESQISVNAVAVLIIVALACVGSAWLVGEWMGEHTYGTMGWEGLRLTEAKFGRGFLSLTLIETGTVNGVTINEHGEPIRSVTANGVNQNCTSFTILEDRFSIIINLDWTSGSTYRIGLETARGNVFSYDVVAPTPLENPFNHPSWHRPLFAYEYW
jgi:F0F1-type ATP synthase membrane subunit c/vacuolar-type H+-ATPase subunit K